MYDIEQVLQEMAAKTTVEEGEFDPVRSFLANMNDIVAEAGISIAPSKALVIAVHWLCFLRRVRNGEFLPALEDHMFDELDADCVAASRRLLEDALKNVDRELDDAEIFYLAVHFESAKMNIGA